MLASACSVDELRSQASGEIAFSDKINNEFIGMGLNGLLVPEDLGGSGLVILEASLISEQIGKFAAPAIWVGNSVMTPMCLSNGDNKELAEKWLPKIADGSSTSGIDINDFISKTYKYKISHIYIISRKISRMNTNSNFITSTTRFY